MQKKLIVNFSLPLNNFSFGALLILKQEIDILINILKLDIIEIYSSKELIISHLNKLKNQFTIKCTLYSSINDHLENHAVWPTQELIYTDIDSFQSFKRIIFLNEKYKIKPLLKWNTTTFNNAKSFIKYFAEKNYLVHLKNIPPYKSEESNANLDNWKYFFQKNAILKKCHFILIGNDFIPNEILNIPGIYIAKNILSSIYEEIALINFVNGFLGMASGLAQGIIFSNTPFVIFKHPLHHKKIMERELNSPYGFSFCNNNQQIWRKEDSIKNIEKAFLLINQEKNGQV
ncbi:MAG: hypothetical protein A3F40_01675 [Chlamydiae bacterium RIFCSPHIGHO2_12_FULL_27_8]|nr:MAG: hypothetical protein A3F40_01675 [Chlamydiae bacterium RIFCSPHIGHO2_12_FULL_27_8]OGN66147.1 MAG: hypothetical protein A2888_02625 [Chlamydiae bacterium RIFCSPLOWO2_01_FULL_28_7]